MPTVSRGAFALSLVSLVSVVGVAAWYGRPAWEDSGSFAVLLFGIPLVCAALAVCVERAGGRILAPVVIAVAGVVSLAWSLLTGLGIGLAFLLPSLLLLVAAMVSWVDRRASPAPLRS